MAHTKYPKDCQEALLVWARQMLAGGKNKAGPDKLEQLHDGAVFSELLEILDPEYDPAEFQQTLDKDSNRRRRAMHIIHLALRSFVRRKCVLAEALINEINFQALDGAPTSEGMCQIITVFLLVSVNLDYSNISQEILQGMSKQLQSPLFVVLSSAQEMIDATNEPAKDAPATPSDADDDLAREAEMAKLHREKEQLLKQNAEYKTLHARLKDSYDELVQQHEAIQYERAELAKQVESGMQGSEVQAIAQKKLKEADSLIDSLEQQLNDAREQSEAREVELRRLEAENKRLKPLQDDNDILKQDNEALAKKANMADNLRKKLEQYNGVEKELKTLRYERNEFHQAQEALNRAEKVIKQLLDENNIHRRRQESWELEQAEHQNHRLAWAMENDTLKKRLEAFEIKSRHDEEMVRDLQDKVLAFDPSAQPETPLAAVPARRSLEDELKDDDSELSLKDLEVSRLQAEVALLRSSIGTESEKGQLLARTEEERAAREMLQEQFNQLFERHTIGQESLNALINSMNGDGLVIALQGALDVNSELKVLTTDFIRNEAYSNLRNQVLAEQNNSKHLQRQLEALQADVKDKEREVLEARGDSKMMYMEYGMRWGDADGGATANALAKDGLDQLSQLKQTDGLLAISLRAELDETRQKYKGLKCSFDASQQQLVTALIDRDQLRKDVETANTNLLRVGAGQDITPDASKTTEKMEKLRARYKKLSEQLEQSEQKRVELEKTVKAIRAGSEEGVQKSQQEQTIQNLQRENAMIATAWYDLNSRLQSNHVVLQRRTDAPKSWLNKQRQLVNGELLLLCWSSVWLVAAAVLIHPPRIMIGSKRRGAGGGPTCRGTTDGWPTTRASRRADQTSRHTN